MDFLKKKKENKWYLHMVNSTSINFYIMHVRCCVQHLALPMFPKVCIM